MGIFNTLNMLLSSIKYSDVAHSHLQLTLQISGLVHLLYKVPAIVIYYAGASKKRQHKDRFAKGRGRDIFGACKRSLLSALPDLSALPTDSSRLPCPAPHHSLTTPPM